MYQHRISYLFRHNHCIVFVGSINCFCTRLQPNASIVIHSYNRYGVQIYDVSQYDNNFQSNVVHSFRLSFCCCFVTTDRYTYTHIHTQRHQGNQKKKFFKQLIFQLHQNKHTMMFIFIVFKIIFPLFSNKNLAKSHSRLERMQ